MSKQTFHFKCYIVSLSILCLVIFSACDNPENNTTQSDTSQKTQVEFTNLEQYSATIYSDPSRQIVITDVAANGTTKVAATPAPAGIAFYLTFHLDIFDMPGISIPYNAPHIMATIEDKKTAKVPIPKLEAIEINSSFIKIKNNSDFPFSLRQGNTELLTLGGKIIIVMTGQNVVYEVTPGFVSSYTFMRNASIPVEFPAGLSEFKKGIIYSFTYTNTGLVLTAQTSVLQSIPPAMPLNVQAEVLSSDSVRITWNEISGATSYRIYRAASAEGTYSSVGTSVSASYTNASLSTGQAYYYKITALSGGNRESAKSTAVVAIMPPANVRVTAETANSVSLAWNAFSGASGYNIYRSGGEDGIYSKVNTATVTGNEFTDTNVSAYTAYFYKVSAIINGIEGIQSSPVSASTNMVPGSGLAAKLNWLQTNALSNVDYRIEVTAAESIGPTTLSYSDRTNIGITLRGTGATRTVSLSSNGAMFTVAGGVNLVLDNNITLQGRSDNNDSLVRVNEGGTLVMNTGSRITGNTASSLSGGGVYVSGTFTMNGGTISGNTASWDGGGMAVSQTGTFTMSGGTISSNTASSGSGGGVYVRGTFTMNGGTISGNTASSYGGGVSASGTSFTMSGGTISSNTASSDGGGVAVFGIFTMSGGTISSNTASSYGGGVSVRDQLTTSGNGTWYSVSGTFTMSGGTVSGNTASYGGGGVYVAYGTSFNKTGGTIYGYSSNVVKNSSGAVITDRGHAVYSSSTKKREKTISAGENLDLSKDGAAGGWVDP